MASIDQVLGLDNLVNQRAEYKDIVGILPSSERIKKPIFIVGCPRSGTTVVAKCLGASPECVTSEESFFLLHLWHIFSDLYQGKNWRSWGPLSEYVDEESLVLQMRVFADKIFGNLLDKKPGASVYVDHTPWYGSIAPFIDGFYPDARYVHVVRDGRAVVRSLSVSYQQGHMWAGSSIEESAQVWVRTVRDCLRVKEEAPDRYFEVRHENLTCFPEETLHKLCSDLNLHLVQAVFDEAQVAHSSPSRDLSQVFPGRNKDLIETFSGWPSSWSEEDHIVFCSVASEVMKSLKYFPKD